MPTSTATTLPVSAPVLRLDDVRPIEERAAVKAAHEDVARLNVIEAEFRRLDIDVTSRDLDVARTAALTLLARKIERAQLDIDQPRAHTRLVDERAAAREAIAAELATLMKAQMPSVVRAGLALVDALRSAHRIEIRKAELLGTWFGSIDRLFIGALAGFCANDDGSIWFVDQFVPWLKSNGLLDAEVDKKDT